MTRSSLLGLISCFDELSLNPSGLTTSPQAFNVSDKLPATTTLKNQMVDLRKYIVCVVSTFASDTSYKLVLIDNIANNDVFKIKSTSQADSSLSIPEIHY